MTRILRRISDLTVFSLAVFAAVNLLLGIASSRLGCNWIWINLDDHTASFGWFVLLFFAAGVLAWQRIKPHLRIAVRAVVGIVAFYCLRDALAYYRLLSAGVIQTTFPLPLSLVFGLTLAAWMIWPPEPWRRLGRWPVILRVGLAAWAAGFCLLAQVLTFGSTDYRRPADAIVVFGAGVNRDGSPSLALFDRTRSGCLLYQQGYGKWLVLSGGPGAGQVSEPQAMKRIALGMRVPAEVIITDERGENTQATVSNAARLARERGWSRLLMVSHNYHLSRISMLCRRAGLAAYTVPAAETWPLTLKPYYVQRELAAWVWYYLKG